MAGFDVGFHGWAAKEAGGTRGLHFGRGPTACGAEVKGGVASGAEEGGEEGEDDYVDGRILAHLGEGGLGSGAGLAVVDG